MKRKTEGDADKGWRLRERWIYMERLETLRER